MTTSDPAAASECPISPPSSKASLCRSVAHPTPVSTCAAMSGNIGIHLPSVVTGAHPPTPLTTSDLMPKTDAHNTIRSIKGLHLTPPTTATRPVRTRLLHLKQVNRATVEGLRIVERGSDHEPVSGDGHPLTKVVLVVLVG